MEIREVDNKDKKIFNQLAIHPLQSWEWGEFRKKSGIEVIRLGKYDGSKLVETAQITLHLIPFIPWTIGYFPRGGIPSREILEALVRIVKNKHCIFIKLEPNLRKDNFEFRISNFEFLKKSPHPLFTQYTFQLDINKSEDELLKNMHPKTRYNIRVAQKHGVSIQEDNSNKAFEKYLELTFETTKRQKFFAHTERYHRLMWETLKGSQGDPLQGIARLLTASYHGEILVTWIVFLFNDVLYYPYGASSNLYRNVMASNLMMWEAIKFGKKNGAKLFDMWGALGPNPDPKDPWYGFHRFKEGYGAKLVEFIGSYDLVMNPFLYQLYNFSHSLREAFLKLKSYL